MNLILSLVLLLFSGMASDHLDSDELCLAGIRESFLYLCKTTLYEFNAVDLFFKQIKVTMVQKQEAVLLKR